MLRPVFLFCALSLMTGLVWAQYRIEVFSTDQLTVTGTDALAAQSLAVEIWHLDAPETLEDELSVGLPADPQQAEREARAYLELLGEDELRARVARAYRAELRARELGIDRYPAVIFDGQFVVYGLTDLPTALTHYRRWQQSAGAGP